ncbi:MAG: hypothetical protein IJ193_05860 [Bacilli bacterium]|nr:hypothetical protein [Bacilli bacterium]
MNNSENNNVMPNGVVPNNTNVNPVQNPTPNVTPTDTNSVAPVAPPVAPVAAPVAAPTASNDTEELLEVAPPTVAPPVAAANAPVEDGESRILRPVVETLEEEVVEEKKEEEVVPQISASESMATNVIAAKEKAALENRNLKEVKVEYKEPGFFRKALMFIIIGALFAVVFFLPDITSFLEAHNQSGNVDEPITEKVITSGTLTCEKSDNDKNYDYIHTFDFDFEKSQLSELNYSLTTKGSVATDVDDLTALYKTCKSLSSEFANTAIGTTVSCDLIGATYVTSYHIDYALFDDSVAEPILTKYKTKLPEYEENQNIDDIQRNLENDGYTCDRSSNE